MHVNPFVQFRLFSVEDRIWLADDLRSKRVFKIAELALFFVIEVEMLGVESAKRKLCNSTCMTEEEFASFLEKLTDTELLVPKLFREKLEQDYKSFFNLEWANSPTWTESLQYYLAGYDFPFADYSPAGDGRRQVRARMNRYAVEERDDKRFKVFPQNKILFSKALPQAMDAVIALTSPEKRDWMESLELVCSGVFGMTKTVELQWDGERLFRRTSPSGGSRHPTEGYLVLQDPDAAYHIRTGGPVLDCIQMRSRVFEKLFNEAGSSVFGAFLFASRFERNMFRYREPRTFRTVHMDVGHLISTTTRYLKATGFVNLRLTDAIDSEFFNLLSNSNSLEEGFISALVFSCPEDSKYEVNS